MKILYCITKGTWGGAQLYVYNLAVYAKEAGHDVTVVAGNKGLLFEKLGSSGIRTILIHELDRNINPLLDITAFGKLLTLFRKEQPDVVHLNSSKIAGIGSLAARITGIPKIVFTAHGWPFLEKRPAPQKATICFLSWLTALFSTDVLDITRFTYERVRRWPFVGKKLHLVYLGIDEKNIPFLEKSEARKTLGVIEGTFAVGLATEFVKNKGVHYAIRAIASIKNPAVQLFVMGQGELENELRGEAQKLGIGNRIHFLGFKRDVAQYFKAFDLLLIPSIKEGLPLTIIEAGHARLPVVATNVGGIPELLDLETGILVPPENHEAIAVAIEALAENPELRERLASRLHTRVRAVFARKPMLRKTFDIYRLSPKPPARLVGAIPMNKDGNILLHLRDDKPHNAPNQWCLIAGHVDEGEEYEAAALRELKEESGLDGKDLTLAYDYPEYNAKIFKIMVDATEKDIVLGEGAAMQFFSPEEALKLIDSLPYKSPHLLPLKKLIEANAL